MDKKAIENFAVWAKNNLENQIELSLRSLGINNEKDIKQAKIVGEYMIIDGDMKSYPSSFKVQRDMMIDHVKKEGFKQTIESVAYTWFNRFIALKIMEVQDFIPHGFRVLSSISGGTEPDILQNLSLVKDDLNIDLEVCYNFKQNNQIEELYRYVLFRQCKSLNKILPMLFADDLSYLELTLPKYLLTGETIVTKLNEIDERNFKENVEIIGWMYQFYVASERQKFREAKLVTKDLIPTLTQVFTPDWIVKYMAENSLGRLYLESNEASPLKANWKYYVEDAEQEVEVQKQIDAIKYKNINLEEIKIIEPCCGSGHILVYLFDMLYQMYVEKGYSNRDIPTLILKNNLYGLEIDKRAAQLSQFSLIIKARQYNNRFFKDEYRVRPKVYEIIDSKSLLTPDINGYTAKKYFEELELLNKQEIEEIIDMLNDYEDAKVIGSLLKIKKRNLKSIDESLKKVKDKAVANLENLYFLDEGLKHIRKILTLSSVMSRKYDVMVTNPPYLLSAKMEKKYKDYFKSNYPNSKDDMAVMFMETSLVKENGFIGMVNPDGWMFISSFIGVRESIISNRLLHCASHLDNGNFDAVVQTVTFVLRESSSKKYLFKITENDERSKLKENEYIRSLEEFERVPLKRFAYSISNSALNSFKFGDMRDILDSKAGMVTGDSERFLRFWWEVSYSAIAFDNSLNMKWYPYQKGGNYRKWYGNNEYVINWENNGFELKNNNSTPEGRVKSHNYNGDWALKRALTWTEFSSSDFSCRKVSEGFLFDSSGPMCYVFDENNENCILGLLNSKVANYYFNLFNPTVHYLPSNIIEIPFVSNRIINDLINDYVKSNIDIAKQDWDLSELSWDFKKNMLCQGHSLLNEYNSYSSTLNDSFSKLKSNEELINNYFIELYNLSNELSYKIEDDQISLRTPNKKNAIKDLISYFVGLIMGRYSLDVGGLAYAGGEWNPAKYISYNPDDDGIVPIYTELSMENGLTTRIIKLVKQIYGEDTYRENIDFIAEALGKKTSESSEETLNRYLNYEFIKDHIKTYQKRPIYWLFTSGKNDGFKCLVYMHRYNKNTIARINSKYFLTESSRIRNELREVEDIINKEVFSNPQLEKQRKVLKAKYDEMSEYGQVLDHIANEFIDIDLDDGVKVNYAKFQKVEHVVGDKKVKVNLLYPID